MPPTDDELYRELENIPRTPANAPKVSEPIRERPEPPEIKEATIITTNTGDEQTIELEKGYDAFDIVALQPKAWLWDQDASGDVWEGVSPYYRDLLYVNDSLLGHTAVIGKIYEFPERSVYRVRLVRKARSGTAVALKFRFYRNWSYRRKNPIPDPASIYGLSAEGEEGSVALRFAPLRMNVNNHLYVDQNTGDVWSANRLAERPEELHDNGELLETLWRTGNTYPLTNSLLLDPDAGYSVSIFGIFFSMIGAVGYQYDVRVHWGNTGTPIAWRHNCGNTIQHVTFSQPLLDPTRNSNRSVLCTIAESGGGSVSGTYMIGAYGYQRPV